MRDIKFRAWDKELQKYINLEKSVIDPSNGDVIETGGYEMLDINRNAILDLKGWNGEVNGISELSLTYGIEVIGNIHTNVDLLEEQ